jgi:hypothetical protein
MLPGRVSRGEGGALAFPPVSCWTPTLTLPLSGPFRGREIKAPLSFLPLKGGGIRWGSAQRYEETIRDYPPAETFAQVSRNPTVRLNTGRPGVESGSGQK